MLRLLDDAFILDRNHLEHSNYLLLEERFLIRYLLLYYFSSIGTVRLEILNIVPMVT